MIGKVQNWLTEGTEDVIIKFVRIPILSICHYLIILEHDSDQTTDQFEIMYESLWTCCKYVYVTERRGAEGERSYS